MEKEEKSMEEVDYKHLERIGVMVGLLEAPIRGGERYQKGEYSPKQFFRYEREASIIYDDKSKQFAVKLPRQIAKMINLDKDKDKFLFSLDIESGSQIEKNKKLSVELIRNG